MVYKNIDKIIRRSHLQVVRWLLGAFLSWLLLGVGAPLATAQTRQSPDAAPATTAPVETVETDQTSSSSTSSQAVLDPTLSTGAAQTMNDRGSGAGLLAATGLAGAGALLARGRTTSPQTRGNPGPGSGGPPHRRASKAGGSRGPHGSARVGWC
ncbi:MAG: hypothetical protein MI924_22225 [Chloroflexales bacterium]|nr:hypothetical protein [Chloroflexales bacterium]